MISSTLKVATTVAAVTAVVSTGGATAIAKAATADKAIDIADTVSDVGSIISNKQIVNKIEKIERLADKASDKFDVIERKNQKMGHQIGSNKGIVESMVGFVTEKTLGKPQRKRAIRNYMDETLIPDFKREITSVGNHLITQIRISLQDEASKIIESKRTSLENLKIERNNKKEAYTQRIKQIKDYKNELITF